MTDAPDRIAEAITEHGGMGPAVLLYNEACRRFAAECSKRPTEIAAVADASQWYRLANLIQDLFPDQIAALSSPFPP